MPHLSRRLVTATVALLALGVLAGGVYAGASTGEPRPAIGGMPPDVNGDGLGNDTGEERIPELILAVGDNGVEGYIRIEDLEGSDAQTLEEAAANQEAADNGMPLSIPVYAEDGLTVVDHLTSSGGVLDGPAESGDASSP